MIKVAIVEDSTELRHLWTDILNRSEGYACVGSFSNAADAVQRLPTLQADVILMDIQLSPTESGIDVIRQVRRECPGSQFMMFTVFENDEALFNSLKAGATGYILKKTAQVKVLEAIQELNEGGSPMSPEIARRVLLTFQTINDGLSPSQRQAIILWNLTPVEVQILELLAKGLFYKEIADEAHCSFHMVKQHLHKIYQKLHVANAREAVNKYLDR